MGFWTEVLVGLFNYANENKSLEKGAKYYSDYKQKEREKYMQDFEKWSNKNKK